MKYREKSIKFQVESCGLLSQPKYSLQDLFKHGSTVFLVCTPSIADPGYHPFGGQQLYGERALVKHVSPEKISVLVEVAPEPDYTRALYFAQVSTLLLNLGRRIFYFELTVFRDNNSNTSNQG